MKKYLDRKHKFSKAAEDIIIDYLKDAIKAILVFLAKDTWIKYGAIILSILSLFFLGLLRILLIPITFPAYGIVIFFVILIFGGFLYKHIEKSRSKKYKYYGYVWLVNPEGKITGPMCPICKKRVLLTVDDMESQFENAANEFFNKPVLHTYKCVCGYSFESNVSLNKLLKDFQATLDL